MRIAKRLGIIGAARMLGTVACASERDGGTLRSGQEVEPADAAAEDMGEPQGVEPPGRYESPGVARRVGPDDLQLLAILQISGMRWTHSASAPVGSRCRSITLNDGTVVNNDTANYTAATSNFTDPPQAGREKT